MGYQLVGRVWTPEGFAIYLDSLGSLDWATSVTIHHTGAPNLKQRPKGWTLQHMVNLRSFYRDQLGWSRGPHLFTDEDQIFGMSSLKSRGVHAKSFNRTSFGIEALGEYDSEDPKSGRGLEVMKTTAIAARLLLAKIGKTPNTRTIKFHRDDPKTSKTCPGKKVDKAWFIDLAKGATTEPPKPKKREIPQRPTVPNWNRYILLYGKWYVPALAFLEHVGGTRKQLIQDMKSKDGEFYYAGRVVEHAFYDKDRSETWAPAGELLHVTSTAG